MNDERVTRHRVPISPGTAGAAGIAGCTFVGSTGSEDEPISSINDGIRRASSSDAADLAPGEYREAVSSVPDGDGVGHTGGQQ